MANTDLGAAHLYADARLRENSSNFAPGRAARFVYGQLYTADLFNNPGVTPGTLLGHAPDHRAGGAIWQSLGSPIISPEDMAEPGTLETGFHARLSQAQGSTGFLSFTFKFPAGVRPKFQLFFRMPGVDFSQVAANNMPTVGYGIEIEQGLTDYNLRIFKDAVQIANVFPINGTLSNSAWNRLEVYFGDDFILVREERLQAVINGPIAYSGNGFIGMGIQNGVAGTGIKELFFSEYQSDPLTIGSQAAIPNVPNGWHVKHDVSPLRAGDPIPCFVRWGEVNSPQSLPPTEIFTGFRADEGSVAATGLTGSWQPTGGAPFGFFRYPNTFHATSTGGQGGATRTGMLRMEVGLRRISSPALATDYSVYSENLAAPGPGGYEMDRRRGSINPRTLIDNITITPTDRGSSLVAPYEFPTVFSIAFRMADVPWLLTSKPDIVLRSLGANRLTAEATEWGSDRVATISDTVDNAYPKGAQGVGVRLTPKLLSGHNNDPRFVFDSVPPGFRLATAVGGAAALKGHIVESTIGTAFSETALFLIPNIEKIPIFQLDDNQFHPTDVFFKHNPALTRDVSQRAFITYVLTTPSGVGLNGITAERFTQDQSLAQEAAEIGPTATTQTVSGQAGVLPSFQTHRTTNPVGLWRAWLNIIAPANAVDLETDDDFLFIVRTRSSDIVSVVNFSNADPSLDGTHYIPGEDMLITAFLLNTVSRKPLPLDAGATPAIAIMRFNPGSGRLEYLGEALSWIAVVEGAGNETAYGHALAANPTDSRIKQVVLPGYVFDFKDVFVIPTGLVYNGTDYTLPLEREIVDSTIRHDVPAGSVVGHVQAKLATGVRGQARRAVTSGSVDQETVKGKVKTSVKGRVS